MLYKKNKIPYISLLSYTIKKIMYEENTFNDTIIIYLKMLKS